MAIKEIRNKINILFNKFSDNTGIGFIEDNSDGPHKQYIDFIKQTHKELSLVLDTIISEIMWSPYVAFYGETNAGKSTLIEALRLRFGESNPDVGKSIGDGRSDFTREATGYPCTFCNHNFTLIDIPGIEGKESVVETAIRHGLTRSHVVFYITSDPRPPQGGDGGREGTLEKIARQLKPQAKVWAIWNKRITNPRGLEEPLLDENSDKWRSLHVGTNSLDAKMHEILNTRYQMSLPVSAWPAFLALATHLVPESKWAMKREQFLKRFSEEQIIKECGIDAIADLIISVIPDAHNIFISNIRKITIPIRECAERIEEKARKYFLTPAHELEVAIGKLRPRLENISDDMRRNLRRLSDELIRKTIGSIRSQMMNFLREDNHSDKDLKYKIESILEKERFALQERIQESVRDNISNTEKSSRDSFHIMKMELEKGCAFYIPGFTINFDNTVELNTDGGIDWTGLCVAAISGVAAVFLTGGWVLVLGIVGALMGAFNSLASFFSNQYKKDQQIKALNVKLYLLEKELNFSVPKKLNKICNDIADVVFAQAQPFDNLRKDYQTAGMTLLDASRRLRKLANYDA